MEVGNINNLPILPKNAESGNYSPAINESGDIFHNNSNQFNYEKVTMGPDEVKTFLYMLIGAEDLLVVSDKGKTGSLVDRFV